MRETRKSREVVVYSTQGHRLFGTSRSEALAQIELGNAKPIRSAAGAADAIQLTALARRDDSSPSGIPASTMQANAGVARWARDKVMAWGAMQQANLAALVVSA